MSETKQNDAPESIWLQWHGDAEPDDTGEVSTDDVTWSTDRMFAHDVRYVRWDLVEPLLTDILAAHADPNNPDYNECETEDTQCQWCQSAAALYPPQTKGRHE
jgi:hypothetical protein